jgi:hypothetical protein
MAVLLVESIPNGAVEEWRVALGGELKVRMFVGKF